MQDYIPYCPYCGSTNLHKTAVGYVEKAVGYVAAIGAHIPGGLLKNNAVSTYFVDAVIGGTPTQYKCTRCGKTFHTSKYNAWYGGDEKYRKGINKKRNK